MSETDWTPLITFKQLDRFHEWYDHVIWGHAMFILLIPYHQQHPYDSQANENF